MNLRALTYEKDRLPALSGSSRRMGKLGLGPCTAGTFLQIGASTVLWHVPYPGYRAEQYLAPTWSWASVVSGQPQQPTKAAYRWHAFSGTTGDTETGVSRSIESQISNLRAINFGAAIPTLDHRQAVAISFVGRIVPETLKIKMYTGPPRVLFQGLWSSVYQSAPHRDFEYFITRNTDGKEDEGDIAFEPDLILHDGPHKFTHGEIYLAIISRDHDTNIANNLLVLWPLYEESDYKRYANLNAKPNGLGGNIYARIGYSQINGLEQLSAWKDWLSDANTENIIIV